MPPLHDDDDGDDLRATIQAAMRDGESDQSASQESSQQTQQTQQTEDVEQVAEQSSEEPSEASGEEAAEKAAEQSGGKKESSTKKKEEESESGDDRPLDPPAKWTKEEKEAFAELDPKVQKILSTRNKALEADYTRKMQEIGQERRRYQEFEQVLAPRREMWSRAGMSDAQALNSIMSYWDLANRDPVQFLQVVAQERGVDLSQMYQPTPADIARYMAEYDIGGERGEGQAAQTIPAHLQTRLDQIANENAQLRQYVQQLGGTVQSQQQAQLQEIQSAANQALAQFESETDANGEPLRPFLNDVREDMSWELRHGGAKDLQEAYDRAVWKRPDVRQKLLESQEIQRRREDERRRQEEAARAKRAGASVSAASSPAPPARTDDDEGMSLRDTIVAAWKASTADERI